MSLALYRVCLLVCCYLYCINDMLVSQIKELPVVSIYSFHYIIRIKIIIVICIFLLYVKGDFCVYFHVTILASYLANGSI